MTQTESSTEYEGRQMTDATHDYRIACHVYGVLEPDTPVTPGLWVHYSFQPQKISIRFEFKGGVWMLQDLIISGPRIKRDGSTGRNTVRNQYNTHHHLPDWLDLLVGTERNKLRTVTVGEPIGA